MRTMKIQRVFPALMAGLLAGCSLLPQQAQRESSDIAFAKRMEFANKEMQVRLQYSDWLLASHPQQRVQERQRLKGGEGENRNLRCRNDILRRVSFYLGRGGCDRLWKK